VGDIEQWPNVVVHASIDYRKEIPLGTREVIVRTRVVDVGRSSVRFAHDVGDGAAGASVVLVAWDPQTRRSREIAADERDALLAGGVVTS
jgi:acyl-CoA thioesterase FadM